MTIDEMTVDAHNQIVKPLSQTCDHLWRASVRNEKKCACVRTVRCCLYNSRRDEYVFALTHGGFLDHRNQRSADKHHGVVLPHCRTVRTTLGYHRIHRFVIGPQASTPSSDTILSCHRPGLHTLHLPVLLLPGCAAMPALAAPRSAKNQSAMIGLSIKKTAAWPELHVARQFCTPS